MNTTVSATGMEVSATAAGVFLEIQGSQDSKYSTTGTNNVNASLLPSAHKAGLAVSGFATPSNWFYQYSNDADDYMGTSQTTAVDLTNENFGQYVAKTTFSVELNSNSAQSEAYKLVVSKITIPADKGVYVVICGQDGFVEFSATADAGNTTAILSNTVTTTAQDVTVYIYINGQNDNVYTNNIANLGGQISFELSVSVTNE